MLPSCDSKVVIMEGAKNNFPDEDSQRAADKITKLASNLGKDDLLIALISGENIKVTWKWYFVNTLL